MDRSFSAFRDQVADAIIAECVEIDSDAYGQVEVSTWSDHVWLSGGICTRQPLGRKLDEIVVETGLALGYRGYLPAFQGESAR